MRRIRFSLVALSIIAGCSKSAPALPKWPAVQEVEGITATVFRTDAVQNNPVPFKVPPEFVPEILRLFEPPVYNSFTDFEYRVATLDIACKDGRVVTVNLEFAGNNKAIFTVNGVPCVRGGAFNRFEEDGDVEWTPESVLIGETLEQIQKGNEKEVSTLIETLDILAGRKRPQK